MVVGPLVARTLRWGAGAMVGVAVLGDARTTKLDGELGYGAARTRSEGSGLGLAIALENARLHGGTITAQQRPGYGAVFVLHLPGAPGRAA